MKQKFVWGVYKPEFFGNSSRNKEKRVIHLFLWKCGAYTAMCSNEGYKNQIIITTNPNPDPLECNVCKTCMIFIADAEEAIAQFCGVLD